MVWICMICICLFYFYRLLFGDVVDKKYYVISELAQTEKAKGWASGYLDSIQKGKNSTKLILNTANLALNNHKRKYHTDHLLVIVSSRYEKSISSLRMGNIINITGDISQIPANTNLGEFNAKQYYRQKNIYYEIFADSLEADTNHYNKIKDFFFSLKNIWIESVKKGLPKKEAGIVIAMITGTKDFLEEDIRSLYTLSGIGHILAISGLHITILCLGIYRLLIKINISRFIGVPVTILFLLIYAMITGFNISTNRAVIMMIIYLIGEICLKNYDMLSALALSAVIILFQNPFQVESASFLLSYGAMLGIGIITPIIHSQIESNLQKRKTNRKIMRLRKENDTLKNRIRLLGILFWRKTQSLLYASIGIQIITLPVTLYFYYEIPTYGIIINLFVIPLVAILIIVSILAGILGIFCTFPANILFGITYGILQIYEKICKCFQSIPYSMLILGKPSWWQMILYFLLVILFVILAKKIEKNIVFLLTIATIILIFPYPNIKSTITMMDVGQGDGIILENENKEVLIVDCGSTSTKNVGEYRLIPYVKYRGIRHIKGLVVTHADEDHISGLLEIMNLSKQNHMYIENLILPKPCETMQKEENYQLLIKTAINNNIPISYIATGDMISFGEMNIRCLHPNRGFSCESANAYSTVLYVTTMDYCALLCGDLEGEGEKALSELLDESPIQIDYLKIAHHGSKNSTSNELLEKLKPKCGLISCGKNNRYGHPHKELIKKLQQNKIKIIRTDIEGMFTIQKN